MFSIKDLKQAATAMDKAVREYNEMVKSVLSKDTRVFVVVKHSQGSGWFEGRIATWVADASSVCVTPIDDSLVDPLAGLVDWRDRYGWLMTSIENVYLTPEATMVGELVVS